MKKILFIAVIGVLLLLSACNGGGGVKLDLSGLVGTWDYHEHYVGIIAYSDGSTDSVDYTVDDSFSIDTNTIIDNNSGDLVDWTYDGETLHMFYNWSNLPFNDPDCGDYTSSGSYNAVVHVIPGAKSANYSGTLKKSIHYANPDTCFDSTEEPTLTGSMTKQ